MKLNFLKDVEQLLPESVQKAIQKKRGELDEFFNELETQGLSTLKQAGEVFHRALGRKLNEIDELLAKQQLNESSDSPDRPRKSETCLENESKKGEKLNGAFFSRPTDEVLQDLQENSIYLVQQQTDGIKTYLISQWCAYLPKDTASDIPEIGGRQIESYDEASENGPGTIYINWVRAWGLNVITSDGCVGIRKAVDQSTGQTISGVKALADKLGIQPGWNKLPSDNNLVWFERLAEEKIQRKTAAKN